METDKKRTHWLKFLDVFNEQFNGRATRLGMFERADNVTNDFWIEDGLPLIVVELDIRGAKPAIRIDLDSYSHEISGVVKVAIKLSASGEEDGIDILDDHGKTTVLRIEAEG